MHTNAHEKVGHGRVVAQRVPPAKVPAGVPPTDSATSRDGCPTTLSFRHPELPVEPVEGFVLHCGVEFMRRIAMPRSQAARSFPRFPDPLPFAKGLLNGFHREALVAIATEEYPRIPG